MHYIHTVYLQRLRHEIKQIKSNVFYLCFLFKITPCFPPTVYLLQPGLTHVVHGKLPGFAPTPHMYMYKIKTTIKKFKCFTNNIKGFEECSPTCPSLCLHGYSGPTGCPLVELYTSWHGWQVDWHLPSCLPSRSLRPHEGHPRLPWPNVGKMPFLFLPLSIVWGRFLSPPSFSSIHAY